MPDIFDIQKRSEIMSHISDKDSKAEIIVRKFLHSKGFRFRKNDRRYPGKPDIILPKYRAIIFVHGCFWHGHDCKASKLPDSNLEFWNNKITRNKERDIEIRDRLVYECWNVKYIWQCE